MPISKPIKLAATGVTILCLAILAVLLGPVRREMAPLPVDTEPIPAVDNMLTLIEKRFNALDKAGKPYPGEQELKGWIPPSAKLILATGSRDLMIIEVSENGTDWRSMTYERGKPQATTRVTLRRPISPSDTPKT